MWFIKLQLRFTNLIKCNILMELEHVTPDDEENCKMSFVIRTPYLILLCHHVKNDTMSGTRSMRTEVEKIIPNFSRKPEGKKPLGRHRKRLEGNIKIDVTEMRCKCTNSPSLVHNTVKLQVLVNMLTNFPSLIQRAARFLTLLLQGLSDPWSIGHSPTRDASPHACSWSIYEEWRLPYQI
jgi:hypothetical protein